MAINRAARRALTEKLAAYMRGEIDNVQLDEAVTQSQGTSDETLTELSFTIWGVYDDIKKHSISISAEGWQTMRRILALLMTDLEWQEVRQSRQWMHWGQVVSVLCLALVAAGLAAVVMGCRYDWTVFASLWVLAGVIFASVTLHPQRRKEDAKERYLPFENERQWKEYEPLVEAFNLPKYNAQTHGKEIRQGLWRTIVRGYSAVLLVLVSPLLAPLGLRPKSRTQMVLTKGVEASSG